MAAGAHQRLDGRWALERSGGLLPPLGLLHKLIRGRRGSTRLGRVAGIPFRVQDGRAGPELVYAGPLRFVVDRLAPDGTGGWRGETRAFGVVIGRFRMRRDTPGD
jgi:hypothetical protein